MTKKQAIKVLSKWPRENVGFYTMATAIDTAIRLLSKPSKRRAK